MGRKRLPSNEERIASLWSELSGYPLWAKGLSALCNYVELLNFDEVEEAIVISAERGHETRIDRFRYCCGILRNKLARKMDPTLETKRD